jgi:16S rRNA processing protein RimM
VGLEGFATISDADRLAGAELRVPEAEQVALPAGTYYHHQLIGCEVVTAAGEALGRVADVQGGGDATRLVVRGRRGEVLIPFVQEFCDVDVAGKRIVVTPPEGLLEVNGDWR